MKQKSKPVIKKRFLENFPLNYKQITVFPSGNYARDSVSMYKGIRIPEIQNENSFRNSFYKSISRLEGNE
mgnify:CR=1 FL=1